MKKIICFFLGHRKAVLMLYEDEYCIYTKGCPRCKSPVGLPTRWKNTPPPPHSTSKQVESWNRYVENECVKLRNSVI